MGPVNKKNINNSLYKHWGNSYLWRNNPKIEASAHLWSKTATTTFKSGPHSVKIPIAIDSNNAWIIIASIRVK